MGSIHHITAITGDPQKNIDFYEGFLGQRLIKKTVNFDDPRSYHFYFGDAYGKPGTLLTFFYWKGLAQGTKGVGEVGRIAYGVQKDALGFWSDRARRAGVRSEARTNEFGEDVLVVHDPDGLRIELVAVSDGSTVDRWQNSDVPADAELHGFHGATLVAMNTGAMEPILQGMGYTKEQQVGDHTRFTAEGERARHIDVFEAPDLPQARQGSGSIHHIAFRAASDERQLELRARMLEADMNPTAVIDRQYFRSVYFLTPADILFEIATDGPGFLIDEPKETLGERLSLPPQFEPYRNEIEPILEPVTLPRDNPSEQ